MKEVNGITVYMVGCICRDIYKNDNAMESRVKHFSMCYLREHGQLHRLQEIESRDNSDEEMLQIFYSHKNGKDEQDMRKSDYWSLPRKDEMVFQNSCFW